MLRHLNQGEGHEEVKRFGGDPEGLAAIILRTGKLFVVTVEWEDT